MTDVDVLIRCVDAGDTYLTWRWLDDPGQPYAHRPHAGDLADVLAALSDSLPQSTVGAGLGEGDFTAADSERRAARNLARVLLPEKLVAQLLARHQAGLSITVRVIPSPRLAAVPWETLAVTDDDGRLLDFAEMIHDLPATVAAERGRQPEPWRADLPPVLVVDPVLPHTASMRRVLAIDNTATGLFHDRLDAYRTRYGDGFYGSVGARIGRKKLAEVLQAPRSRLFYFGHVTATPDEPGSAAMHLTDSAATTWGLAEPVDRHRPLCALDLLAGVLDAPADYRAAYGPNRTAGHQIWPMPPRVAMVSCEGAADYRATETFGLVSAMVKAGAELVTTTRWTLPTDTALWAAHPELRHSGSRPTTELALVVDTAHTRPDPIAELAAWQRRQLESWRSTGDIAYTPLIWASLTHTWAPATTPSVNRRDE